MSHCVCWNLGICLLIHVVQLIILHACIRHTYHLHLSLNNIYIMCWIRIISYLLRIYNMTYVSIQDLNILNMHYTFSCMHLQVHHIHNLKASCMRQLINLKLFCFYFLNTDNTCTSLYRRLFSWHWMTILG